MHPNGPLKSEIYYTFTITIRLNMSCAPIFAIAIPVHPIESQSQS